MEQKILQISITVSQLEWDKNKTNKINLVKL